ncbi:MAG TPA: ParB/RepB/Spo0J family partition protein [Nitrososphaeraceae archaeon]|jgi:ParB family chromosome partitioning protein
MSRLENTPLFISGVIQDVSIFQIKTSTLCRPEFGDTELNDLSNSIKQQGLLQPIVVRTRGEYFEIVAGNRRYAACKSIGWRKIGCHVVELDDRAAFEVSLIENLQRKTLTPIDEAKAFKEYVSKLGWGSTTDLAIRIGKSVSYVTKRIKLLDLPDDVLRSILNSKLSVSVAEELNYVKDNTKRLKLMERICEKQLSLREAREIIKNPAIESENEIPIYDFLYYGRPIHDKKQDAKRILDKSITALRIAMIRLVDIVESTDNDWVIQEILMQHKNMLHEQINILIRQKMKYQYSSNL